MNARLLPTPAIAPAFRSKTRRVRGPGLPCDPSSVEGRPRARARRTTGFLGALLALAAAVGLGTLDAVAQQASSRSNVDYPNATQVGEAIVTSDPETRKIIVVTDDETAQQIGQVITNLDRPAPQVLIKVIFLEVTYRDGLDFGIEGGTKQNIEGNTSGSASQVFSGFSGLANSATGLVRNVFGIPGSSYSPVPPGAGIYQILGDDFQVTLRAIAAAGKLEVLSRPSILARNNQQATINVGQRVPLITNVRYDNFGNQINGVTYENVGINLSVTPFITTDGMVEMIVSPEISQLSEQGVAIAEGVEAPIIDRRAADTVVITPDSQTVVIGGLMQSTKTESESKVPWLGDVPGLGWLFKRTQKDGSKTELLIFLTPHIVKRPTQLAAMTAQERANLRLIPQSITEQELDRILNTQSTNTNNRAKETGTKSKRSRSKK